MQKATNLVGRVFGRLTVLYRTINRGPMVRWRCHCVCGTKKTVDARHLTGGNISSCGCLRRDLALTHGLSHTPVYRTWARMKVRCKDRENARYGGRGIQVAPRWWKFEHFLEDMGPRPHAGLSIDRKENNGHYALGNCRWATRIEQARNRSTNRLVLLAGRLVCLVELQELGMKNGIKPEMVRKRIRLGWPAEKATSVPVKQGRPRKGARLLGITLESRTSAPRGDSP